MAEARVLWRHIVRTAQKMPPAQSTYYRRYAKQLFVNYNTEDDPEEIKKLVSRGFEQVSYIVQKYEIDKMTNQKTAWKEVKPFTPEEQAKSEAAQQQASEDRLLSNFAKTQESKTSRLLKVFTVEVDVLGQLVVSRIESDPSIKTISPEGEELKLGDVLVEMDGTSVRGKDPAELNAPKATHSFKFGRRTPAGAIYFEVQLMKQ